MGLDIEVSISLRLSMHTFETVVTPLNSRVSFRVYVFTSLDKQLRNIFSWFTFIKTRLGLQGWKRLRSRQILETPVDCVSGLVCSVFRDAVSIFSCISPWHSRDWCSFFVSVFIVFFGFVIDTSPPVSVIIVWSISLASASRVVNLVNSRFRQKKIKY